MNTNPDILIVDDTAVNLTMLSHMLNQRGYKVRAVMNGTHALAAATTQVPDLILLDIMMPDIDGFEVCRQLKANALTRDTPIIFISAMHEISSKVDAFKAGAVDYIPKPFQLEEVLARVETHLALRDLRRELQAANAEMAQQVAQLQARNEELDAFAHTVAHDLKSPLTTIMGYAQTAVSMREQLSREDVDRIMETIARRSRHMDNIIEELLLLAGVRQASEVELVPLDMGDIVEQALSRLSNLIEDKQAEIIQPETWPACRGYGPWVEEVWVNYISNAIKYGGDPPRVELGSDPQPDGSLRFWVRDNGAGISPEMQDRLFMPFERLAQVRVQGYGLGLSIVRRIMEKLGQEIGVESDGQPGQGSTFSFTLEAIK